MDKEIVFDISVFQHIKDTFYEKDKCSMKSFIENHIISKKIKIHTTDYVKSFIQNNLGAVAMIFDDILDTDENINIEDNSNSIIKFFSIKKFEGCYNYFLVSNNALLIDKIKAMGFDTYTITEFSNIKYVN